MAPNPSDQDYWQQQFHRQRIANAQRWLKMLEETSDPTLLTQEYGDIMHAIESTLPFEETFDLVYALLQAMYTTAYGYGDWDRWLNYLQQAYEKAQTLADVAKEAHLTQQIAGLHFQKGDLALAYDYFNISKDAFSRLGDSANFVSVSVKMANLLSVQGKSQESIAMAEAALEIAQTISDPESSAVSYLSLAYSHIYAREWDAAIRAGRSAQEYYQRTNNRTLLMRAISAILAAQVGQEQWQAAEASAQSLHELATAGGDVRMLVQVKNMLGIIAFNLENYQAAEAIWQDVVALNSQLGEMETHAALHNNLGKVYTKLSRWQLAQEMFEKAINTYTTLGNTYKWANAMDNLADLHEATGNDVGVKSVLRSAVERLESLGVGERHERLIQAMQERLSALT